MNSLSFAHFQEILGVCPEIAWQAWRCRQAMHQILLVFFWVHAWTAWQLWTTARRCNVDCTIFSCCSV